LDREPGDHGMVFGDAAGSGAGSVDVNVMTIGPEAFRSRSGMKIMRTR